MNPFEETKIIKPKSKIPLIIIISILVVIISGLSFYFYQRYQEKLFKEKAIEQCKQIARLINQEKYSDAETMILETDVKVLPIGKDIIVSAFKNAVKSIRVDTEPETISLFKKFRELGNAINMEASAQNYDLIKYIDGVIALEQYSKYNAFIKMTEGNEIQNISSAMNSMGLAAQISWDLAEPKTWNVIELIRKLDLSEYGYSNYGISEMQDIQTEFGNALVKVYNGQQNYDQNLTNQGKKELDIANDKFQNLMYKVEKELKQAAKAIENLPSF